jgi:hypothetical protein
MLLEDINLVKRVEVLVGPSGLLSFCLLFGWVSYLFISSHIAFGGDYIFARFFTRDGCCRGLACDSFNFRTIYCIEEGS